MCDSVRLLFFFFFPPKVSNQIRVIRGNPASRGTEASAEVLVGPPWRMESNAGQRQQIAVIR